MSKQIEALKLALEALTNAYWPTESDLMPAHNIKECADAITAIKEALAQSEQDLLKQLSQDSFMSLWQSYCDKKMEVEDLKEQLEQLTAQQKPPVLNGIDCSCGRKWRIENNVLTASEPEQPPQRKPLTDQMTKQMRESCDSYEMRGAFVDGWLSAEAAHGIKGEA